MDLRRRFVASEVLSALHDDASLTMFFGVPTMYGRLVEEARRTGLRPRPLRLLVSGSAPLSPQLFHEVEETFGQRILERYGMTETLMNTTNPYEGERRPGTVGMPYPGQEARVVDVRTRQPLPAGETGEIEVRGPHVFAGYWQRPDATAESFDPEGWFRTGDLGLKDKDGYFQITGRARELIISGGFNVYPREVEEVLASHPAVAEVAVLGLPDADFGEQVVAVVVPTRRSARARAPGAGGLVQGPARELQEAPARRLRGGPAAQRARERCRNTCCASGSRRVSETQQRPGRSGTFRHSERKTPRARVRADSVRRMPPRREEWRA